MALFNNLDNIMTTSTNSLNTLHYTVRPHGKNQLGIRIETTSKLYTNLLNTDAGGDKSIADLLSNNKREKLSEYDKETILYTLDYLRIKGADASLFNRITPEDMTAIKSKDRVSDRVGALLAIICERYSEANGLDDDKKRELGNDINEHLNHWLKAQNSGFELASEIALTRKTTNRCRRYGKKIRDLLEDKKGDISKCYIDVIKYANYASMRLIKRTIKRYIVPIKFKMRDIPEIVTDTLEALNKRSSESKSQAERLAIDNLVKYLSDAFDYYKVKLGPSQRRFDAVRYGNQSRIFDNNGISTEHNEEEDENDDG